MLWTPPQCSGLLAGVFREELIARGEIRERVIRVDELHAVKEFFLINSVRKWIPAVLVD
ncbi:MAG: aminotransferase class IV [Pyrinomonadaceae bacterium]